MTTAGFAIRKFFYWLLTTVYCLLLRRAYVPSFSSDRRCGLRGRAGARSGFRRAAREGAVQLRGGGRARRVEQPVRAHAAAARPARQALLLAPHQIGRAHV